jgi:hypothetical protein
VLTAFLVDPEPFLNGSRRLAGNVASTAARSVTSWIAGALGRLVPDTRWLLIVVLSFRTTFTLAIALGR